MKLNDLKDNSERQSVSGRQNDNVKFKISKCQNRFRNLTVFHFEMSFWFLIFAFLINNYSTKKTRSIGGIWLSIPASTGRRTYGLSWLPARLNFAKQILAGKISLSWGLFFGKGYFLGKMHWIVLGEKSPGDVEYSVCDEESRKNINRIVQMPQKNSCAKKESRGQKYFSQTSVLPIYEAHEKREASVGRKEKIILGRQPFV